MINLLLAAAKKNKFNFGLGKYEQMCNDKQSMSKNRRDIIIIQ